MPDDDAPWQVTLSYLERQDLLIGLHRLYIEVGALAEQHAGSEAAAPIMALMDRYDDIARKLGGGPEKPTWGIGQPS